MSRTMLIDASHPEETRVAVVNGTRLEELDFESAAKRQIRGNVYLARVTRVEPSLQAAFVEFGGNRHGFLAFSEIHPDYYQIPVEDRKAIIEAEQAESLKDEAEEEQAEEEAKGTDKATKKAKKPVAKKRRQGKSVTKKEDDNDTSDSADNTETTNEGSEGEDDNADEETSNKKLQKNNRKNNADGDVTDDVEEEVEEEQTEQLNKRRKRISKRRYKIQEVIKRGQILLIQAVKEERGNKGAAVTTYMSLAGRYCVLMPNTPRGGGISRKISNGSDRKRLKTIMSDLSVPNGMGLIVRTAGAKRTKAEIKRDFTYLSKLWDNIRNTTLESVAPALIHEEANLVKRSIRDLYGKDIDKVYVQGDEGYRLAKDFIKLLMPSHAKNVQPYSDDIPLFLRYQVESQIEGCLEPIAQLKSGGYLVIHPTEALVSVDVNSGRSTKERNVERTALKTNLEAAEEVARQMRLRDLAGLVVIDFIDMDQNRNNRAVEKKMRDALAQDRARVQMGRISQFGLMELSRQRRRRSLLEGSSASCEHCHGVGRKRSVESSALKALRAIEEEGVRCRAEKIRLKVTSDVAAYLFNEKRELVNAIETDNGMFTEIISDNSLIRPAFSIDIISNKTGSKIDPLEEIAKEHRKSKNSRRAKPRKTPNKQQTKSHENKPADNDSADNNAEENTDQIEKNETTKPSKSRRRRGRRGGKNRRTNRDENKNSEMSDNKNETKTTRKKTPNTQENIIEKDVETKKTSRKPKASTKKASSKQDEDKNVDTKKPSAKKPRSQRKPTTKKVEKVVSNEKGVVEKDAKKGKPKKASVKTPAKNSNLEKKKKAKEPKDIAPVETKKKTTPKKSGWWQKRKPFG